MSRLERAWRIPVRLVFGVFFLHTGQEKTRLDDDAAARLHAWAVSVYPPLKALPPATFVRAMAAAELSIASSLLIPVVPSVVGGTGLTLYGGGLSGLYFRTPGMRRKGSVRPTERGLGLAKDAWMVASGAALVVDALAQRRRRKVRLHTM